MEATVVLIISNLLQPSSTLHVLRMHYEPFKLLRKPLKLPEAFMNDLNFCKAFEFLVWQFLIDCFLQTSVPSKKTRQLKTKPKPWKHCES